MQLTEYHKRITTLVNTFKTWWIEKNKIDPSNFPLEMEEGDWDEQLTFFDCGD